MVLARLARMRTVLGSRSRRRHFRRSLGRHVSSAWVSARVPTSVTRSTRRTPPTVAARAPCSAIASVRSPSRVRTAATRLVAREWRWGAIRLAVAADCRQVQLCHRRQIRAFRSPRPAPNRPQQPSSATTATAPEMATRSRSASSIASILVATGLGIFVDWTRNSADMMLDSGVGLGNQTASMWTLGVNLSL